MPSSMLRPRNELMNVSIHTHLRIHAVKQLSAHNIVFALSSNLTATFLVGKCRQCLGMDKPGAAGNLTFAQPLPIEELLDGGHGTLT